MPVVLTREEVEREGRERLNPRLSNPSWLVLRKRRQIFQNWMAALPGSRLKVLDIGGRIQPYRPLLADRVDSYIAIDLRATPLVDVLCRAEELPFCDAEFDVVISTQVLQYVYEPQRVISEAHRVLKPGGCLFLSVPGAQIRDAQEECWRFLPEALRRMLSAFARVEIQPEGGSVTGFFRTMNSCLNVFVRYSFVRSVYQWTLCPMLNLLAASLEGVAGDNDQFVANYSVLAQK
jgi:SAM-dependent methyltransferase